MGESSEGEGFSSQHWIPIGIQPLGVGELGDFSWKKGKLQFFLLEYHTHNKKLKSTESNEVESYTNINDGIYT